MRSGSHTQFFLKNMTYAHVELVGTVRSVPDQNSIGDSFCWVEANFLRFKVVTKGNTLEGFYLGDLLHVKGKLRAGLGGTLVVMATVAETPPQ